MATISLTVPAAAVPRVRTAFCATYGYAVNVPNPAFDRTKPVDATTNPQTIPNPVTPDEFVRGRLLQFMREIVQSHESDVARRAILPPAPLDVT